MDPYDDSESLSISPAHERDFKGSEHEGSETLSDETYCGGHLNISGNSCDDASQLNISGNSCDCAGYFEMPDSVMDIYLLALDGGNESNAALRQMSDVYGPKDEGKEVDSNCNHNVNPELRDIESCGCSGGTSVSADEPYSPYEHGVSDKKLSATCIGCQEETYQRGLANKKPVYTGEYEYDSQVHHSSNPLKTTNPENDENYQEPLVNKKPGGGDQYMMTSEPYCAAGDSSCCYSCNDNEVSHGLVKYKSKFPDRSNFYADESGNNNVESTDLQEGILNWEQLRKSAYNMCPAECVVYSLSDIKQRESDINWVDDRFETTVLYNLEGGNQGSVNLAFDFKNSSHFIQNDLVALDTLYVARAQTSELVKQDIPFLEQKEEDEMIETKNPCSIC